RLCLALRDEIEGPARIVQQDLPLRRQPHGPRGAFEQANAKLRFHPFQGRTGCCRRDAEGPRCPREAAGACSLQQHPQVTDIFNHHLNMYQYGFSYQTLIEGYRAVRSSSPERTATMKAVGYRQNQPITDDRSLEDVELPTPAFRPRDLLV